MTAKIKKAKEQKPRSRLGKIYRAAYSTLQDQLTSVKCIVARPSKSQNDPMWIKSKIIDI